MTDLVKKTLISQYEAALAMLNACVRACPEEHWDTPIAKYAFWIVVYHTLYCTDIYLEPREEDWKPSPKFHPAGMADIEGEYPSRRFEKPELLEYIAYCLQRTRTNLAAETEATLAGDSGVSRLKLTRLELHLHNLRHIMHHTGQLSAALRKAGIDTPWVRAGWRE
ncbi:MAG: DinB family protein [Phycisphaerales bacterium]|nr:DinB family protein [Phycisphaerales bacterium]